jgi:hypothetical protein
MMKLLFLALAIASCLLLATHALSEDEIDALNAIAKVWTQLGKINPPWTPESTPKACTPPVLFGLTCSEGPDPHVTVLYAHHPFLSVILILLL